MARLIATVLITKHFQTVCLVHVIKFELRHGKDIVSYKLRGLEIFLVVGFIFKLNFIEDAEYSTEPKLVILVTEAARTETKD